MRSYTVYFSGVSNRSREDVFASSVFEAEATIAARYSLAYAIKAVPLSLA